jgi:hypothetical protein
MIRRIGQLREDREVGVKLQTLRAPDSQGREAPLVLSLPNARATDARRRYSGIIGNVQNVGNLAVGANSRIDVTNIGQPVAQQLLALRQAVEAFDGPIETRAEMLVAHREVAAELEGSVPDKGTILTKLRQIAGAAGSASTIAGAVTALATALQLVL